MENTLIRVEEQYNKKIRAFIFGMVDYNQDNRLKLKDLVLSI